MNKHAKMEDRITRIFNDPDAVRKALQTGVNEALKRHKQLGFPICVWQEGKVVWIAPENIRIGS